MITKNLTETEIRAGLESVRVLICQAINPVDCDAGKKIRLKQIHPLTGSKSLLVSEMRGAFDAGVAIARERAQPDFEL